MKKTTITFLLLLFAYSLFGQLENTISNTDKIYGLSKIWQEVNYNFVFIDRIDKEQWDNEYKRLISEVQNTENDFEFYRLLMKYVASLNDGHTRVYMRNYNFDDVFGNIVLMCSYIDEKVIVTRVHRDTKNEIPVGTEIRKINGQETIEYLYEHIVPYINSSTEHHRLSKAVSYMFATMQETTYNFALILPGGEEKNISLTQTDYDVDIYDVLYPPYNFNNLFEFKWVAEDIAYMAWNSFGNPAIVNHFKDKLPEIYNARKLIIDLRNNDGGNTLYGLHMLEYLTNDTILYGVKSRSRIHIPAHENDYYDFPFTPFKVNREIKKLVVPTVFLIGPNTISAAEDILVSTDNQNHIITVGEATAGSTGESIPFNLPGGGWVTICTRNSTFPCGEEYVGYGIQPDIKVSERLYDVISGNDPVLNKAIEYLNNK